MVSAGGSYGKEHFDIGESFDDRLSLSGSSSELSDVYSDKGDADDEEDDKFSRGFLTFFVNFKVESREIDEFLLPGYQM